MLRRSTQSVVPSGIVSIGAVSCVSYLQRRSITSRGQFNPIHDFTYGFANGVSVKDQKEFEKLITNPGPLRVTYSNDYLDWLYRGYQAKIEFLMQKKKKAQDISSTAPIGFIPRPNNSIRRRVGELKRQEAQEVLNNVAVEQGMLDLLERQPQFPTIHIDRCTRFHLVEIFKEIILDRALEPMEVWDKALLYRAILLDKKNSYPNSFRYIFEAVDEVLLFQKAGEDNQEQAETNTSLDLSKRCPSEVDFQYFMYLVKKYYVENAVEGHVVLRCHREANAADLLFSNPPPRDDDEVRKHLYPNEGKKNDKIKSNASTPESVQSLAKPSTTVFPPRLPTAYPPIEALWRCAENLPLLKVLVFSELNLIVSENPFIKFPSAQSLMTRPYSTAATATQIYESSNSNNNAANSGGAGNNFRGRRTSGSGSGGGVEGISLASVIAEKRGHLLSPIPRFIANAIDGRAADLTRLQQRHHRDDIVAFQKLLRRPESEENTAIWSSYSDWTYFNPHTVRAEDRDRLSQKALQALKEYDEASVDIYRDPSDDANLYPVARVTEENESMPSVIPTLTHFVSIIKRNPHVSFLDSVVLTAQTSTFHFLLESQENKKKELERYILQLARALYHMAVSFHKEEVRRVEKQKVNICASLLDSFVTQELHHFHESLSQTDETLNQDKFNDDVLSMAMRLGKFVPFATRIWDETGFPSDARKEDYDRWMAPPKGQPLDRR